MSTDSIPRKQAPSLQGKIKWRRFALILTPTVIIMAALVGLTANGAIAASMSVSGQEFLVTAKQLNGTGFDQFGGQVTAPSGTKPVVVSAIHSATLAGLCQQVTIGGVTLTLRAGGGGTPVSASNLIVDASSQSGSEAVFHNITIGQDSGSLSEDPGASGPAGGFGQEADSVTINNLVQHTWLTTAGTFTLPNLTMGFGGSC